MTLGTPETVHTWSTTASGYPWHALRDPASATGLLLVCASEFIAHVDEGTGTESVWNAAAYSGPIGALTSAGTLLVADGPTKTVRELTSAGGDTLYAAHPDPATARGFEQVALSPDGTLWVSTNENVFYKFAADGSFLRSYNGSSTPSSTIPENPRGFHFTDASTLYVSSKDGVWVTDPANEVDVHGDGSYYELPFTQLVADVTYNKRGVVTSDTSVYVADAFGTLLSVPTAGGSITVEYDGTADSDFTPYGLSLTGGYLYLASTNNQTIYRWLLPATEGTNWHVGRVGF